MDHKLRRQSQAKRADFLQLVQDIAAIESPSHDPVACDGVADYLERYLLERHWQLERVSKSEVGDQLIARIGQESQGASTLILCHYDTVWPLGTLEHMPLRQEGNTLYGPGVMDMKGGIAMALLVGDIAQDMGLEWRGPVTLLLNSDEEIGSLHSSELIKAQAKRHDRVIVLEAAREDGAVKVGRKGSAGYHAHFHGISSHSGNNPKEGASALREMAHFLLFIEGLEDMELGTSINVNLASGGSATNVISEYAEAQVDMRMMRLEEFDRVDAQVQNYVCRDERVRLELQGGLNRPPMEANEANMQAFKEAQELAAAMDIPLESAVVGGGSDGNFTSALGVPTLDGFGVVGQGLHARHEQLYLDETLDRLAVLVSLLCE